MHYECEQSVLDWPVFRFALIVTWIYSTWSITVWRWLALSRICSWRLIWICRLSWRWRWRWIGILIIASGLIISRIIIVFQTSIRYWTLLISLHENFTVLWVDVVAILLFIFLNVAVINQFVRIKLLVPVNAIPLFCIEWRVIRHLYEWPVKYRSVLVDAEITFEDLGAIFLPVGGIHILEITSVMELVEAILGFVIKFLPYPVLERGLRFGWVAQRSELHGYIRLLWICYYCPLIRPNISFLLCYKRMIICHNILFLLRTFCPNLGVKTCKDCTMKYHGKANKRHHSFLV